MQDDHGIEPGYWDISGQWHETLPGVRQAILQSLGGRDTASCTHVLAASAPRLELDLDEPVRLRVYWEQGGQACFEATPQAGILPLPSDLPLGYHLAVLTTRDRISCLRLIVCPDRVYLPPSLAQGRRRAGLAVSLFGVRSDKTWGCGDFTALHGLIDWVVDRAGGDYIALNPLHAIHNRQPFNTSPYLPNSSFYRNFIYLDIDRIEDLAHFDTAKALRHHRSTLDEIRALNESEFVEYEKVAALKQKFLRLAYDRFRKQGAARLPEFRDYIASEGDLLDQFALYSALDEYLHSQDRNLWIWPGWPEPYRDPASPEVRRFRRQHASVIDYFKYVQWQLDIQAREAQAYARKRGMEIGLFHDLPLATDKCGAELWSHGSFYVQGCRVGSPPDSFAPEGQDWSFPPPNRDAHRRDGYRLFAQSIRHSARHGGALRIDHVMRLFRLYWIPDGFDATQGTYVRDYPEDLLRILALESHRQQVLIVGEDLGTVEASMREALDSFGILSYRLFYFERDADGAFKKPAEYPVRALVSSTTHDLPTLAGFWAGKDIETRHQLDLVDEETLKRLTAERQADKRQMFDCLQELGLLPLDYPISAAAGPVLSGELHNAITGFLASTPSLLMTLNQEDLTKELEQQNLPATTWQYPNWRRKMKFSIEDLEDNPLALAFARMLRSWLVKEGRCREEDC